jgi:hypothetical protein
MKRWGMSIAGVATAAALILGGGGIAYADSLEVQADSLAVGVTTVAMGSIACNTGAEVSVDLFIDRGGNAAANTYKSGSTVTFSKTSQTNVSASPPSPATVVLRSDWATLPQNSSEVSASSSSAITVPAGTTNGDFSGSVAYRATGVDATVSAASLVKNVTVSVTWSVVGCGVVGPTDNTPPVVELTCPTEPVSRGATAHADWTATDEAGGSGLATPASGQVLLDTATLGSKTATAAAGTAEDNAGNESTLVTCGYTVVDRTPPVVTLLCPTDPVGRGTVAYATWTATDEAGGSGLATPSSGQILLDTSTLGDYTATAEVGTAKDNANNESIEQTCGYTVVDVTAPVVSLTCPASVVLGSTAYATWTAADEVGGSGLATEAEGSLALDTSTVGSKSITAPAGTAVDNAGNESIETESCLYSVVYDFAGFFRPVDMGNVVNSVKAGSAVPMKFSLGGDQGLDIVAAGWPKVTFTTCTSGLTDAVEETLTAGGSSLTYDAVAGQYVYVWKTDKSWAGKCGTFALKLNDGTTHTALFKFLK